MEKLTSDKVKELVDLELDEFKVEALRKKHGIASESAVFYMAISRLVKNNVIKRLGRGFYQKVYPVEPVEWWNDDDLQPFNSLRLPFGLEDSVELFPGDLILIAGASNYGKTALALNILASNLGMLPKLPVLMGSEYTASNGKISPKFKRRLNYMNWVNWFTDDKKPRFTLLPIDKDFESYIEQDALNVIDWVSLAGDYFMIDRVMKASKDKLGYGLLVMVIQKDKTSEFGEGGERTERYADLYLKIDPFGQESLLTVGKVKSPKGYISGRKWAFNVVDYGARLSGIHEVAKCKFCNGYGKNWGKLCTCCNGLGYADKAAMARIE